MDRVYYDFRELEEYRDGMWRIVRGDERKILVKKSADLMMDPELFKTAMLRALDEWPNSCQHNLTCEGMNRIAWLGHAGCCLNHSAPEDCTRAGWYKLDDDQMAEANKAAAEVLESWLPSDAQMVLI